jgi:Xaa-Pro dipeptidase
MCRNSSVAENFPHHAGHGLRLSHPENPYLVRNATETLTPGDVVTLEPGLYLPYLITQNGYERLSNHTISLQ